VVNAMPWLLYCR